MVIEDCLDKVATEHQGRLLRELLEIEIALKDQISRTADDTQPHFPTQRSYTERFPEHAGIVDSIVRRLVRQKQIGDYDIIDELGYGGMGVVYKARQKLLNQIVAVKVLPQSLLNEPQAIGRFRREMQLIGGLNHPNIVRALNAGEADGTQYLVMEFVDGKNLQGGRSREQGTGSRESGPAVPLGAVCEIIRQAALGLQHAHEFGLVHRDIKPANLMLDRQGTVKVLDLGLGKFLSERRDDEQSLTAVGVTMGTVDYISPEQAENAGNVDIRADIYSLGCTFYFLATGNAPYSGSRYDSARKKLMAHIVGEIPALTASVPEAKGELEKIVNKMLAKNPNDRFQTPLEVAEALEPFADFDALLGVVETLHDEPAAIRPGSSRIGTRTTPRPRPMPKSARDMWLTVGCTFLLPAILGLCFALCLPVIQWARSARNAEAITETQLHLAQLPGLNGGWWFDEIPWYLPSVREMIQRKLEKNSDLKTVLGENPEKYFDPNAAAVHTWLRGVVYLHFSGLTPLQRKLVDKLDAITSIGLDNAELEKHIFDTLTLLVATYPADKPWSAVDQHSRALLEHRLALLKNDRELAMTARKSYRSAITLYRQEIENAADGSILRRLEFLCLADAARLAHLADGDYKKANDEFEAVFARRETNERLSPLFSVELRATQGALCAEGGNYDDSLFRRALETMERSKFGERSHPLKAYIHERYAWSLIDQWKVKEAEEQFSRALDIRKTNRNESKNPLASIYVFHNQHGLAMTYRYCGNTNRAVGEYRKTLDQIDKERAGDRIPSDQTSSLGRQYYANLRERAANTRERLADCTLYGGVVPGKGQLDEAVTLYAKAAELYDTDGPRPAMRIKQAIALLLLERLEEGENILAALDKETPVPTGDQTRTEKLRQLADAVLVFQKSQDQGGSDEGKKALQRFLRKMGATDSGVEGTRRENLEMRLFAAEFLLNHEMENNELVEAERDVAFLKAPLVVFWNKPETRPFIRRIAELTVRLGTLVYEKDHDQKHLDRIVETLQWMRGRELSDPARFDELPVLAVFFVTGKPEDGMVVVYPQDGRPGDLYRLPLTRQQVKNTARKIKLDANLRQAVADEKAAGRTVVTSWSDAASWARPEDALSDADWPFGEPL